MAHFAKLDDNNRVLAVHVVVNEVITVDGVESEQVGIDFLTSLHGHPHWKQTSYKTSFRKQYAGIGYTYRADLDAFVPPKPYASWILDEETCGWQPPIPMPTDGKVYTWNEDSISWVEVPTE